MRRTKIQTTKIAGNNQVTEVLAHVDSRKNPLGASFVSTVASGASVALGVRIDAQEVNMVASEVSIMVMGVDIVGAEVSGVSLCSSQDTLLLAAGKMRYHSM
jgi:hypothetical protein